MTDGSHTTTSSAPFLHTLRQAIERVIEEFKPAPDGMADQLSSALEKVFADLELVPKHEFDRQLALLARLEERVTELEARLAEQSES